MLAGHGVFTWGDTSKDCYEQTLRIIRKADAWLKQKTAGKALFGGAARAAARPAPSGSASLPS